MKKIFAVGILAFLLSGCEALEHKYVVIHHKNMMDTVMTGSYVFYKEERIANMHEGGFFTEVEYVRRIEK